MAESLEDKVLKENDPVKGKTREFDIAHWLGSITGYVGSIAGAYLVNKFTGRPYLSAAIGSTVGDYAGYEVGFTPYWYLKNTDRYKGISGKAKFAKDWVSMGAKALVVDAGAYLMDAPLSIAGTYMTGNPVIGAALGGLVGHGLYWLGLRRANKEKIAEVAYGH